ncbi:MAG TPA: asparagine--tRNA ligase [Gemmatimonadota bacterium]|jgi:asparaginyl-tRNA synthetase|nr:asparagine--tRNA ligase [Gemmatimonadota bacterium]
MSDKQRVSIADLRDHVGETVELRGWLYNQRSSGRISFLLVRDGSGIAQCVLVEKEVGPDTWSAHQRLTQESSLIVRGKVREDARAPGGYELALSDVQPVQIAEDYPIGPKEHGIDFLLNNRHLWLRSSRPWHIMRIRDEVIFGIREFFRDRGFVCLDSPILTRAIGEEAGTLFETEYFDLGNASLAQTGQLYVEAGAMAHGKVYCFGPTFRAEKSKTRRHLTEFWMLEPEMAWYDWQDNMALQEELVEFVVQRVLERRRDDLSGLGRDASALERVERPFPRLSYDEAVELLQGKGSKIAWGQDFGGEDQTLLTAEFDRPVFVHSFPKAVKAFYMKEHPERPEVVLCDDLFAPEGYGEIIGGSQREDDLDRLIARIREQGLPEEPYDWYLDLRKYGSVPHSGFGLGLERTVSWICGLDHLREAIPFPRLMNRITP